MVDKMKAVIFCVFSCFLVVAYGAQSVPVVVWSNSDINFNVPLAGHTTSKQDFKSNYLGRLAETKGQNIIAFVQDKLSLEDITNNADVYNEDSDGGAYRNLKSLVEENTSVQLPSVESAAQTIKSFAKKFQGKVHQLAAPYLLRDLPLDPDGNNLIIANLPTTASEKKLAEIDQIMGSVSSDLKSQSTPFTALYTGQQPSKMGMDGFDRQYLGRHLLAEPPVIPSDATFLNHSDCIYLFTKNISIIVYTKDSKDQKVPNRYYFDKLNKYDTAKCANNSGEMTLKWTDLPSGVTKFNIMLKFNISKSPYSGYWVTQITMDYDTDKGKADGVKLKTTWDVYAPYDFSYHCTDCVLWPSKNNTDVSLIFQSFQLQFSEKGKIEDGKFGRANDCTGFFSALIWSGIIVGFVMLGILWFGLMMISSISTMDRFDDPKGKTIQVNVSD